MLYAIPTLIGINLLTFLLFFVVNTPDDMARLHLGVKRVTPEMIEKWKQDHGYNKPLFLNRDQADLAQLSNTIFFEKSLSLFLFEFGHADDGRDIRHDIFERMGPSLAIAIPGLILGLFINITVAMTIAFFRATYIDYFGVMVAVVMMSISAMFYIIGGQFLFSKILRWVPISGFSDGLTMIRFLILPILIGLFAGIGGGTRWYRTLFLEEMEKDYVRTARAKGLSPSGVIFGHVLRNAMIPILTGVVVLIPFLFMGSLLTESFFGIPGLGSYTIDAINSQDFGIVRSMVFLGSVLYIVGLIATDIAYAWADPRVRIGV
jgi:peptide/nickel transport system permease protein